MPSALPAVEPERRADGVPGADLVRPEAAPIRILLVDDSDRNLAALHAVLGDLDAEVVPARSGAEALRALLRDDFALILLDVRMPGMDGFETAELIRSRDRTRSTPIIFVTGFDRRREDEIRGYALGAVDFLSKPIIPEVLRGKVAVVIELQRKSEEIRRQAALLDETRRRAHARALEVERQRWEEEALRARIERERQAAELLQRSNARLRLLSETANDLLLIRGPEPEPSVGARIFERVASHLRLEIALWHRTDPATGPVPIAAAGLEAPAAEALARAVEAARVEATGGDPSGAVLLGPVQPAGVGAGVSVPLMDGSRCHGVMTFATRSARRISEDELATLGLLARGVAATLERWRLLRALNEQTAELKEVDARKDQFLAMLGHELRNPLAPVLNAVTLMNQAAPDSPIYQRVLHAADRQIRHMTRLLEDLLDVSRIRNGKIELKRRVMDLRDSLQDALLATEPTVAERGHSLAVHLPDAALPVHGDPVRLAQVFANLLHNAAKYTDRGGHLELRAERRLDEAVVVVRDDGIGIPPEMLSRVFEVFVQMEQGPDRARGGLGLGLTLVRNLVEMHGGSAVARSGGLGQGSEFEVTLPIAREAFEEAPGPACPAAGARSGVGGPSPARNGRSRPLRIVLVDDNADIRDSLKALLELHGHTVEDAEDGRAGIELIRAKSPEVALVDIGLPGLDGYEVAKAVRAAQPVTRLVAMTGYGRPEDRRLALDAGFDEHLVKPVDFDALSRVLQLLTRPEPEPGSAS